MRLVAREAVFRLKHFFFFVCPRPYFYRVPAKNKNKYKGKKETNPESRLIIAKKRNGIGSERVYRA